jgi:amino acid adenylation domain-containing protein
MVEGMLGVLKAGGAYLPLEAEYPAERLQYMMEEAGVRLVLSESGVRSGWEAEGTRRLNLDEERAAWASYESTNLERTVNADNLAYVIYTSGSTGRPKGVMVTHGNLNHLLWSMKEQLKVEAGEVMLAVTTMSFDIAGLEIYLPLISGGQVAIYGGLGGEGKELLEALAESGAGMMQGTPTMWGEVIGAVRGEELREVRVLCGGEALSEELGRQLRELSREVWNLYGPTETTIWSLAGRVGEGGVKLGQRIGKTEVYVLDERQEPVPVGVKGELYIGGKGVGRGYCGRAELTAERFVPHRWSREPGARLYRTGDVCRYGREGELEYVGRRDEQVKIRGQRIELREIEAALNEVAGVSQSVVVAQGRVGQEQRLVGYVVSGGELSSEELRQKLRQRLPEYMVPNVLLQLAQMPLTPNGKIDRQRLPEAGVTAAREYVAARTPVEELLTSIWQEVLGLTRPLSIHDNFFDLGGHSLLATRIVSRVRKAIAVDLPLRAMFESPTIAELSVSIAKSPRTVEYSIRAQAVDELPLISTSQA